MGDRFNIGKTKWSFVVWPALIPMVEVLEYGAKKYAPFNYTKGLKYTEICDSLLRHTYAFLSREDNDPESKLAHVGHILCNAMMLSYMFLFRKDMDDRVTLPTEPNNGKLRKAIEEYNKQLENDQS